MYFDSTQATTTAHIRIGEAATTISDKFLMMFDMFVNTSESMYEFFTGEDSRRLHYEAVGVSRRLARAEPLEKIVKSRDDRVSSFIVHRQRCYDRRPRLSIMDMAKKKVYGRP